MRKNERRRRGDRGKQTVRKKEGEDFSNGIRY